MIGDSKRELRICAWKRQENTSATQLVFDVGKVKCHAPHSQTLEGCEHSKPSLCNLHSSNPKKIPGYLGESGAPL